MLVCLERSLLGGALRRSNFWDFFFTLLIQFSALLLTENNELDIEAYSFYSGAEHSDPRWSVVSTKCLTENHCSVFAVLSGLRHLT